MNSEISRRDLLGYAAVIGAGVALLPAGAASAEPPPGKQDQQLKSANGWGIETRTDHVSTVWQRPVSGTALAVAVRIGDVEALLVHVVRRFHYEVERLEALDLAGWRDLGTTSRKRPASNLSSGTAVHIRPGAGAKGSYFPLQVETIWDILADCEGLVRWAGADRQVDESLYYLNVGPDSEHLPRVAQKIRDWTDKPGAGAGVLIDTAMPARRKRAAKYR
ncbi:hypothetical protein GCM10027589_17200 [Actinocorallia lasiicapitis]